MAMLVMPVVVIVLVIVVVIMMVVVVVRVCVCVCNIRFWKTVSHCHAWASFELLDSNNISASVYHTPGTTGIPYQA